MINFLFINLFQGKRRWILGLSCVLFLSMLIMLSDPFNSRHEELLYVTTYQLMYIELTIKIITLVMPFIVIILAMDHDQTSLKPFMSYFGKGIIYRSKMVLYVCMLMFIYVFLFIYVQLMFWMIKPYLDIFLNPLDFLHLFLDGLLVLLLIFYFIRDKYKATSIVFGILYLILQFIQEDSFILILAYLFPLKNVYFDAYILAIPYKVCYISLGLILTYRKFKSEEIYLT
jgi:hypothetical protein